MTKPYAPASYVCVTPGCNEPVTSSRGRYCRCDKHRRERANGHRADGPPVSSLAELARRKPEPAPEPEPPVPAVAVPESSFAKLAERVEAAGEERQRASDAFDEALRLFQAHPLFQEALES